MPPPANLKQQLRRYRCSGLSANTLATTSTQVWGMSDDEANHENRRLTNSFAIEGASLDLLAELTIKYRQQDELLDKMSRKLSDDNLTASFYNTMRLLISDSCRTLAQLGERRDKDGRDRSKRPEKKAEERKERQELIKEYHYNTERERQLGYFFHTKHGVIQPANDILGLDLAIRDVIRMRMLPKSPHEDYMIAKEFDALTEEEKQLNPDNLSKDERNTDLHEWYPGKYAVPGVTKFKEQGLLVRRIFLERVQEYNKVWEQAEKHVDGLMAAKGIKPRSRYPYLGIPPIIRKVAEGDPEAIKEFERELNSCDYTGVDNSDAMEWEPGYNPHPDPDYKYPRITEEEKQMGGKACTILLALFLAFTCAWTCLVLVLGQPGVQCSLHCSHHSPSDDGASIAIQPQISVGHAVHASPNQDVFTTTQTMTTAHGSHHAPSDDGTCNEYQTLNETPVGHAVHASPNQNAFTTTQTMTATHGSHHAPSDDGTCKADDDNPFFQPFSTSPNPSG